MSGLFDYSVDRESMGNCLGLIERALARVAAGHSAAAVGEARGHQVHARPRGLIYGCASERRAWVLKRWREGASRRRIADETGCPLTQVETLTKNVPRHKERRAFLE